MPLFRFEEFELDVDLYLLSRAGKPLSIGPKPFDLLHYLIRNAQRAVPKAELIREIWHAEAVSDSSIPTCVAAIRRALGDDPDNPKFIQTVRGRGYRFIASAVYQREHQRESDPESVAHSRSEAFVGRQREMNSLSKGLTQSLKGRPQTFLLTGDAGMGKTRIIEEFTHRAKSRGADVLIGRCREEDGAPAFWPWIQILRSHIESHRGHTLSLIESHAAVISQMLPDLRDLFPAIDPLPAVEAEQARFRLLDAITRFFQTSAKKKPLALLIDDLHRADTSSLLLLEFLVRELSSSPIFVLGAYRDLDIIGDSIREQSLARVARSATTRTIHLRGISRRAVSELVGKPKESRFVSALYEQSGGNPFFLTQLVQALEVEPSESGDCFPADWHLELPLSIKDAISSQLGGLPTRTRQALTVASVIGRDFAPALLARGLEASIPETLEQLEPAIAARLISAAKHRAGNYRFSHALLRDVVYDQIPQNERAQLHERIGEALEALHVSDLDSCIAELAHHFGQSAVLGETAKAIAYCIAAGEQAISLLAHENAPEHFRMALKLLGMQDAADPRKQSELLIKLGDAEMQIGERESAKENLLHAARIARQIGAPELLASAALELAPGFFSIEVGAYDPELVTLLREARTAVSRTQHDLLVRVTSRLAMAAVWSSTNENCECLSAIAISLARELSDPITKAYALRARHGALWGSERFEERCRLISELGELAAISGDAEISLMYRIFNISALLEQGDIVQVDRQILEYKTLTERLQLPHARWYVGLYDAMRALLEGRYTDASSAGRQFLELGNRVKDSNAQQSFGAHLILILWVNNRLDEASRLLERFIAEHPTMIAWKCVDAFFLSELESTKGERAFKSIGEFGYENIPINETWAISIQMLSNTCCNLGDSINAEKLYRLFISGKMHHTIVGYGVMSWGSRARELGNLASMMELFEEAEEHFELAISQNRKTGGVPWVASSQADYARMLLKRRDPANRDRIRELLASAERTANDLGMKRLKLQILDLGKQL